MSKLLSLLSLLLAGTSVWADPITWSLSDATFRDGGRASGFFVFDADTRIVLDYAITVTGGDEAVFPAFLYAPGAPWNTGAHVAPTVSEDFIVFDTSVPNPDPGFPLAVRQLRLAPLHLLTDAGGIVPFDLANAYLAECYNCNPDRLFVSGEVVAGVPEPSAIVLGLTMLGFLGLRRSIVR